MNGSGRQLREGQLVQIPKRIVTILYETRFLKGPCADTPAMLIRKLEPGERIKKTWGVRRPGIEAVITGDNIWLILIPGHGKYPISESAFEIPEEDSDADP